MGIFEARLQLQEYLTLGSGLVSMLSIVQGVFQIKVGFGMGGLPVNGLSVRTIRV